MVHLMLVEVDIVGEVGVVGLDVQEAWHDKLADKLVAATIIIIIKNCDNIQHIPALRIGIVEPGAFYILLFLFQATIN